MAIIIDVDASLVCRVRWVEYSEGRSAYTKWELNGSFPLVLWFGFLLVLILWCLWRVAEIF